MKRFIFILLACVLLLQGCGPAKTKPDDRKSADKFLSDATGGRELKDMKPIELSDSFQSGSTIQYSEKIAEAKCHYKPSNGWMGDIHPVYIDGKWYLYYLQVPGGSERNGLDGLKQALTLSGDLVNWNQESVTNSLQQRSWWAIGNLLENGKLYSVYNDILGQGYGLDTTEDFKNWKSGGNVLKYTYVPGEPRDPYLFKNDQTGEYWLIFAVSKKSQFGKNPTGGVYYAKSKDLETFEMPQLLYEPGNITVPECPELFKLGNKYYLMAGWGTDRVGTVRYRVSDSPEGPWEHPANDRLDSTEVMVGNSATDGNRRLMFGWIPTYKGHIDNGQYEWGGHLAFPRELVQGEDGSLYVKAPAELDAIRKSVLYPSDSNSLNLDRVVGDGWCTDGNGFEKKPNGDFGEVWLNGEYSNFDLSFDLYLDGNSPGAGFVFRTGNNDFDGYEVYFDQTEQRMVLRNHKEQRTIICETPVTIKSGERIPVRIIVDGDIVEVFLDEKYVLTGRAQTFTSRNKIGFFTEGGGTAFQYPKVYGIS